MLGFLRVVDDLCKPLVWVSIAAYFIELHLKTVSSVEGPRLFLYLERTIAVVFMVEYFLRLAEDRLHPDTTPDFCIHGRGGYATSVIGIVDLLSWLPFLIGFFVPVQWLGVIRAFRLIRLAKFFRYSRSLQLVALAFYRAWPELRSMAFVFLVVALFNTALIHEVEKSHQPETFGNIANCAWYVIVSATTVGYGDMYPQSVQGRAVAGVTLLMPTLMIYAGMVGVVGSAFSKVVSEEVDPSVDPIELFHIEWERRNAG
jgi:voltage-gated potassium channel